MREILFRGKKIYDHEWIEGYYCRYETTQMGGGVNKMHRIVPCFASALYGFEVDSATVGQYTGLTDKNGKRIFEGDILEGTRLGDKIRAEVVFIPDIMSFGLRYPFRKTAVAFGNSTFFQSLKHAPYELSPEVIGNIHDNPELLKGEKE